MVPGAAGAAASPTAARAAHLGPGRFGDLRGRRLRLQLLDRRQRFLVPEVFIGDRADPSRGPQQRNEQEQKQPGRRCAAAIPGRRRRHPARRDGRRRRKCGLREASIPSRLCGAGPQASPLPPLS